MSLADDLQNLIADWVSTIANRAVDADPDLRQRLNQLDGRTLELVCSAPELICHLEVHRGSLRLLPGAAATPNVVVRGSASSLLNWLLRQDTKGVQIDGDDTTLLATLAALRSYNPELAESLTQVFGEEFSQRLVGTAEAGLRGLKSALQGLGSGLEQQASERYVKKENLDDLLNRIDELRLRVDRLAANIKAKENPP
ncbi:MAG: hypothetical protein RJQ07_07575 [Pseudomonadales bacterium]